MPRARGRVRRVAPRFGARARRGRVRHAAVGVHQRPRPHRAGPGAVHAPARPRRRARRRRHHRVVGGTGRLPGDAQRVEHRAARRRARARRRCSTVAESARSTTSPRARAVLAVQGPEARARLATVSAEAAAVARFAVEPRDFSGDPGWVAGTGYTGEDGVELHVPVSAAAALLGPPARSGDHPCGPRRPRHAATRGRPAPPRPRAGPGHHAAAGRGWPGSCASTRATSGAGPRSRPSATAA